MIPCFSQPRRRFLGIVAASAALLGPAGLRAALPQAAQWDGIALGADARIQLLHPDPAHAQALLRMALAEIERLEQIFSLYRPDSALVRLNEHGFLENPPADLARLLTQAIGLGALTDGGFDPSVQSLWHAYAQCLAEGLALPPSPQVLRAALKNVDYRAIRVDSHRIELEGHGLRLTLNGIAQGYITDCITELLAAHGLEHALIDLGEARSLGCAPGGRAWRAGIAHPRKPGLLLHTLSLRNQALATSSGQGTPLDRQGKFTHLFNPHTGGAQPLWKSVSVLAPTATVADALSTAFSHMPQERIQPLVSRLALQAWLLPAEGDGQLRHLKA